MWEINHELEVEEFTVVIGEWIRVVRDNYRNNCYNRLHCDNNNNINNSDNDKNQLEKDVLYS